MISLSRTILHIKLSCSSVATTSSGYYRCRGSKNCIHPSNVCDGSGGFDCDLRDDEEWCYIICPANCTCYGFSAFCNLPFDSAYLTDFRFLDASGSGILPAELTGMHLLADLNVAFCGLSDINLPRLPNLLFLNLSHNRLTSVQSDQLQGASHLRVLSLASNPVVSLHVSEQNHTLPSVSHVDVSNVSLSQLDGRSFYMFTNLVSLNLSSCGITEVNNGFEGLKNLQVLDLRGSSVNVFPRDIFSGLLKLRLVYTDSYKLCCPITLPEDFNVHNCQFPSDEISSCDALLRSDVYRVVLAVLASLTLLGNSVSFVYRAFIEQGGSVSGYAIFVLNLCVSDFLMGVYLGVIGVVDRLYQGTYLWEDVSWRQSVTCSVAGVVSLLSNEVSAFTIFLITVDRFLVLRFPFSSLRFERRSAYVACALAWVVGLTLGLVPLLPGLSHWQFYSHKSICIPLPITREDFAGHSYSFGVIVCLNFVLCVLIALGQVFLLYFSQITSCKTTKQRFVVVVVVVVVVLKFTLKEENEKNNINKYMNRRSAFCNVQLFL